MFEQVSRVVFFVVVAIVSGASRLPAEVLNPEIGWTWAIVPQAVPQLTSVMGIQVNEVKNEQRKGVVVEGPFAVLDIKGDPERIRRLVAIGPNNTRLNVPAPVDVGGIPTTFLVPGTVLISIGVEEIDRAKYLEQIKEAANKVRELKLPYFGFPTINARYEFSFDYDGKQRSPAEYIGKIVIVDPWATWCRGCMELKPVLVTLTKEFSDRLLIISICRDGAETAQQAATKRKEFPDKWVQLDVPIDTPGGKWWSQAYAGEENLAIPRVIIVDQQGIVRHVLAAEGMGQLETAVRNLLRR